MYSFHLEFEKDRNIVLESLAVNSIIKKKSQRNEKELKYLTGHDIKSMVLKKQH